jgi:hypothetical protein
MKQLEGILYVGSYTRRSSILKCGKTTKVVGHRILLIVVSTVAPALGNLNTM